MKKQFLILVLLFSSSIVFPQQPVFVKSNEIGNGILVNRAGECFVITPEHVVFETSSDILIKTKDKVNLSARLLEAYDSDLAILRLKNSKDFSCNSFHVSAFLDKAIENQSTGTVEYLDDNQINHIIHVSITSKDVSSFSIIPQSQNIGFRKGMSGSSFYINFKDKKVLAGMLMSMEEDSKHAYVMQIDDVMRTLSPFFDIKTKTLKRTGKKNIGVMIFRDNEKDEQMNYSFVNKINESKSYKAYDNFTESLYVNEIFDDITSGRSDLVIPDKLKSEIDELFMGNISFAYKSNRKSMYTVSISFTGGLYSTSNFEIKSEIIIQGKGVAIDKLIAEKLAVNSLISNLKTQFK